MERYVVTSAWPYVNNVPHLGTMIGSLLSGDVYTRFLKLMGRHVVYVSGSDEHGSPIEVEAKKLGIEPKELTDKMHEYVSELIRKWNIEFTNYTRTHNPVHIEFVRSFMMKIYENGLIKAKKEVLPYCEYDRMFLADRFVEGTCPYCGYEKARGDQCDNCGRLLHPTELLNPRCVFCGRKPTYKETTHWFFELPKIRDELLKWLKDHPLLHENVKNYSLKWVEEGLKERSVTRDNKWGIPAPFPGAENKTIYVWFEALLGYVSAVKEYYEKIGKPEEFEKTWLDKNTKTVFFIGKDNIPFHAILFPAMLIATRQSYPLPWQISATEYLLFQEEKFSKSRGIGVWADEALEILPADYWRFALVRMRPETKDISFNWREFYRIVNTEINDDIGNYIHRILSFLWRRYDGVVPEPKKYSEEDKQFISYTMEKARESIKHYEEIRLKNAIEDVLDIARKGNQYLNHKKPWETFKSDKENADTTMYIGINTIRIIAILMFPVTPSFSTKIFEMLNIKEKLEGILENLVFDGIKPGHKIVKPKPLFGKLPENFLEKLDEIIANARENAKKKRPVLKQGMRE